MSRCDAQNAFNHPSFGPPSTTQLGAGNGSTVFNNDTSISSLTVNGRSLQLTGRITF